VAGTNGKGSVIAYLAAMASAAGHTVHAYTSPHLVRFHERIALGGQAIPEADLSALLEECEVANGGEPITFFEITTAAAFLAFNRNPADLLLLETGLGGRLDATNVVDRPRLSVLTPISIDHVHYLGDSLAQIAAEKAGILKPEVPAVIAPQPATVQAVVRARAHAVGSPLHEAGADWSFEAYADGFTVYDGGGEVTLGLPALPGAHQVENAAVAVACARQLPDLALDTPAIRAGLAAARWPGRLQRLAAGPLVDLLASDGRAGWEVWLDGGHNAAAGEALAQVVSNWTDRPFHLIYGMLNTKAARGFLRPLAERVDSLHAVAIPGEAASLSAEDAAAEARAVGFSAQPAASVEDALAAILAHAMTPGRVLICGSLYLSGEVLSENG
jgi:dihydrofolate synthase/folylpolyglutamate synthase